MINFIRRRLYKLIAIALLVITLALGDVLLSSSHSSQSNLIRTTIRQAKQAWVDGDAAAFAALFTTDGELIVPGQRWQGRAAIEAETARFVAQFTVAIEIQDILVEGDRAAVAWAWKETPKAATQSQETQSQEAEDAILVEFEAGQIRRWREYIDTETPKAKVNRSLSLSPGDESLVPGFAADRLAQSLPAAHSLWGDR